jgi:hypothetical protein
MHSFFWFLAWLLLFTGVSTTVPAPPPAPGEEVVLIDFGDRVTVAGGDLALSFVDVVTDSRCPADVTCAWAGEVAVALEVQVGGQPPQALTLGGPTNSRGLLDPSPAGGEVTSAATVGGYEIQLLAVTPYPATAASLPEKEEYQISLLVRTRDNDEETS